MAIYHENSDDAIETEAFLKAAGALLERAKELAQVLLLLLLLLLRWWCC